jgi:hypothetical protein
MTTQVSECRARRCGRYRRRRCHCGHCRRAAARPAYRHPSSTLKDFSESVLAGRPYVLWRELPFNRNAGCLSDVITQLAKEPLRRPRDCRQIAPLKVLRYAVPELPQRRQFRAENLKRVVHVKDILCPIISIALVKYQDLLGKKRDRVGYLELSVNVTVLELERPRVVEEEFDMAQLLRGDAADVCCRFPISSPVVISTRERAEEFRIEPRLLAGKVVMGCGRAIVTQKLLSKAMRQHSITDRAAMVRQFGRHGDVGI